MKSQCTHGHEMTDENTYTDPRGYRHCRACRNEIAAHFRERHHEKVLADLRAAWHRRPKNPRPTEAERFAKYFQADTTTGCIVWTGAKNKGYGYFRLGNRHVFAHRWAYEQAKGPIPEGLTIDHLCCNRWCVNPDHMEPVPLAENTRRQNERKRKT